MPDTTASPSRVWPSKTCTAVPAWVVPSISGCRSKVAPEPACRPEPSVKPTIAGAGGTIWRAATSDISNGCSAASIAAWATRSVSPYGSCVSATCQFPSASAMTGWESASPALVVTVTALWAGAVPVTAGVASVVVRPSGDEPIIVSAVRPTIATPGSFQASSVPGSVWL